MLTSSMVQINVDLPESNSKAVAPSDLIVMITKDGKMSFNGRPTTKGKLKSAIGATLKTMSNKDNASVSIVGEVGVPWVKISDVVKIAQELRLKAHIATQPKG